MTLTREQKVAVLRPLVDRLCLTHCWRDHRHVDEPFTAARLNEHVTGAHKYGLCPIAPGESTCRVALLDLDSHKGDVPFGEMRREADVLAFALEDEGLQPRLWRSSGGNGIHILMTWAQPQEAYSVRQLLMRAIASCGFTNGTGGVGARQLEVFPKQDAVPADGFGSMFVLGYAGKSEPLE